MCVCVRAPEPQRGGPPRLLEPSASADGGACGVAAGVLAVTYGGAVGASSADEAGAVASPVVSVSWGSTDNLTSWARSPPPPLAEPAHIGLRAAIELPIGSASCVQVHDALDLATISTLLHLHRVCPCAARALRPHAA